MINCWLVVFCFFRVWSIIAFLDFRISAKKKNIVASREASSFYPSETKAFGRNEERATKERMPRKKEISRMEAGGKDERRWKERKKERKKEGKKETKERTN